MSFHATKHYNCPTCTCTDPIPEPETESDFVKSVKNSIKEEIKNDAINWGNALNESGWTFMDVYEKHTGKKVDARLFNSAKSIIRECILTYIEKVEL